MIKKVAILGSQGVPACYGGFETLVENIIGENCSENIKYTVFCSSIDLCNSNKLHSYKGASLKYIKLRANGIQSIPYDILSLIRVIHGFDVVVVLGVSGCMFLPIFRLFFNKKLIVNIDGLEYRREKWGHIASWILHESERMAVKYADVVIADNKGIQDYVCSNYSKKAVLIAYGGDHVIEKDLSLAFQQKYLSKYGLEKEQYAITVCRVEPENNCHLILEAFAKSKRKLVFIGNWNKSSYGKSLLEQYKSSQNIQMISPIYDIKILYVLRVNACMYVHGHSAGGTNPSLVEAMFMGIPILCYDVVYNRETTKNKAYYWKNVSDLCNLITSRRLDGSLMKNIAYNEYTWKHIAAQYEALY